MAELSAHGRKKRRENEATWKRMLRELDKRQRFANQQYAKMQADEQKAKEDELWGRESRLGVQGAALGTMINPGWGTAIGYGAGKLGGALSQGMESGQWGKALSGMLNIPEDLKYAAGSGAGLATAMGLGQKFGQGKTTGISQTGKPTQSELVQRGDVTADTELMLPSTGDLREPQQPFQFEGGPNILRMPGESEEDYQRRKLAALLNR